MAGKKTYGGLRGKSYEHKTHQGGLQNERNTALDSPTIIVIDPKPLVQPSGIAKVREMDQNWSFDATAVSSKENRITAAPSTIPGKPEISLVDSEQQKPLFELRASGPRLEMLTSLCDFSQHVSKQQQKLTNYLQELAMQCKEPGEDNQTTAESHCQHVKTLADSMQNFYQTLRDAITTF